MHLRGGPPFVDMLLSACAAKDLGGARAARRFPGGYLRILDQLEPEPVWIAWSFVPAGERRGLAYDGLVRLGERWAWFPKPWRHLAPVPGPRQGPAGQWID